MEVLCFLPSTNYPLYDFDLRATHARTLLPAALASVSFGFVLVRVRVRFLVHFGAPGKQSLKSPCFVSSYFPCFNFFPIHTMASQTETSLESDVSHLPADHTSHNKLRAISGFSFPGDGHRVSDGAAEDGDALAMAAASLRLERASFESPAATWLPLADRLRDPTYTSPALLPLPRAHEFSSTWTWFGDVEWFELSSEVLQAQPPPFSTETGN